VGKSKKITILFRLPHKGLARDDLASHKFVKGSAEGFLGVIVFAGDAEDIIIDDLYPRAMPLPGDLRRIEDDNSDRKEE
jgi:hypothetical protein